jgi:hypothetical protein
MQSIQHSCNTLEQTPVRLQILQGTHRQETKKILTSPQTICLKFMIMWNDTDITGTLNHPNEQQCNVGKKHKTPRKKHTCECAHSQRHTYLPFPKCNVNQNTIKPQLRRHFFHQITKKILYVPSPHL